MTDIRELLARAINNGDRGHTSAYDCADAILAALKARGLVIVPRKPTRKMVKAGDAMDFPGGNYGYECATSNTHYRAMLAASPFWSK